MSTTYSDDGLRRERTRKIASQARFVAAKISALRREHLHTETLEKVSAGLVQEMKRIVSESRLSLEEKEEIFQNLDSIASVIEQHRMDQMKTLGLEVKRGESNGGNGHEEL
jgi:hypothetical protein